MTKLMIGGALLALTAPALSQGAPATAPQAHRSERVQTRAELQAKVAEHFAKVDANRDGAITKAEADAAMQAFHARFADRMKEHRENRRDNMFERLDTNRDGAVSRAEWDAGATHERMASHDREGRPGGRGFKHADMVGFGGRMFEMADANKDGRITLQEAQAAALQHFDMADTNRDGRITPDERRKMHERMRSEHRG